MTVVANEFAAKVERQRFLGMLALTGTCQLKVIAAALTYVLYKQVELALTSTFIRLCPEATVTLVLNTPVWKQVV